MTDWYNAREPDDAQLNTSSSHHPSWLIPLTGRRIVVKCNTDEYGSAELSYATPCSKPRWVSDRAAGEKYYPPVKHGWVPQWQPPCDNCPGGLTRNDASGRCLHDSWMRGPGKSKNWLYVEYPAPDDAVLAALEAYKHSGEPMSIETDEIEVGDLVEGELDPGASDNSCGCEDGVEKALADGSATSYDNLTCTRGTCGAVRHRARVVEKRDMTATCTPPIRLMSTKSVCNDNNWDQSEMGDVCMYGQSGGRCLYGAVYSGVVWSSKAWDAYETMGGRFPDGGGIRKLAADCTNEGFQGTYPLYVSPPPLPPLLPSFCFLLRKYCVLGFCVDRLVCFAVATLRATSATRRPLECGKRALSGAQ